MYRFAIVSMLAGIMLSGHAQTTVRDAQGRPNQPYSGIVAPLQATAESAHLRYTTSNTGAFYECSIITNTDGSADQLCDAGVGAGVIWQHATDPDSKVWSAGTVVSGIPYSKYPYAFKIGPTYYVALNSAPASLGNGDIYLYAGATVGGPYTVQNGGAAVFVRGSGSLATIFNPGIAVDGTGKWHFFIETSGQASQYSYVTSGCPSTCNFNTNISAGVVLNGGGAAYSGNPMPVYVPDRNALLVFYGGEPSNAVVTTDGTVLADYALLSSDLTSKNSWHRAPGFVFTGGIGAVPADPTVAFSQSSTTNYQFVLGYSYQQVTERQAYSDLTLDQLYDVWTSPFNATSGGIGGLNAKNTCVSYPCVVASQSGTYTAAITTGFNLGGFTSQVNAIYRLDIVPTVITAASATSTLLQTGISWNQVPNRPRAPSPSYTLDLGTANNEQFGGTGVQSPSYVFSIKAGSGVSLTTTVTGTGTGYTYGYTAVLTLLAPTAY